MKKAIKIFSIILSLSIISIGCSKFLELDPPYTQDAENFFLNESDYLRALTGAYDLLQGTFISYWIGDIASDNCIAGGESATDTEGLHQIEAMNHGAVNNELRSLMRFNYCGIARCNFLLEPKENEINFPSKATILAEAKFLRAFYYFELVKFFGDIPLVIDERLGVQQIENLERTPANQVYAQIEQDLNDAISILSYKSESTHSGIKGRVDKGAALGLLGKVYLYQDNWSAASQTLNTLINSTNYSLVSDYNTMFLKENENNSETVFDIEYSDQEGGSYGCLICLEGNLTVGYQGIRQYDGPSYGDGNSYNLPTQNLFDSFENYDPRRAATCINIDDFIANNSVGTTYGIGAGGHTGFYNHKYMKSRDEMLNGIPDNDLTSGVNYRVIRYADVLLMAAEALNQTGEDSLALVYLNQVRARVGLFQKTSSSIVLYEDILKERRSELSCEGHRFFDLVRTGKAASEITNFVTGKHELFPIPQDEIDLAGGNWSQNPGY
jgi:starch-binding outer membrane protein, SusD/RagB family